MEKLTKVKIMLINGDKLDCEEVLDVGNNYYYIKGNNVREISKSQVAQIQWFEKETTNDSSKYIKGDDGSCTSS